MTGVHIFSRDEHCNIQVWDTETRDSVPENAGNRTLEQVVRYFHSHVRGSDTRSESGVRGNLVESRTQ